MDAELFVGQCRFYIDSAERMFDGLRDEHSYLEPVPGNKTAGWILGHLCITGDFARRLCGRKGICPVEWRTMFRPGTSSGTDAAAYPPMADLCRMFREVYSDLCEAIMKADDATLTAANPIETARAAFPTAREFVPYIMTGHLGYHLGQLGDWRRAAGLGHKSLL
jgi:hypothetical protein